MSETITTLLAPDGPIARRITGFESRPQQTEMARAVEHTLAGRGHLLVEAGTGVGVHDGAAGQPYDAPSRTPIFM